MVDKLHFLPPGDGSGGIDEYCFCFISRHTHDQHSSEPQGSRDTNGDPPRGCRPEPAPPRRAPPNRVTS